MCGACIHVLRIILHCSASRNHFQAKLRNPFLLTCLRYPLCELQPALGGGKIIREPPESSAGAAGASWVARAGPSGIRKPGANKAASLDKQPAPRQHDGWNQPPQLHAPVTARGLIKDNEASAPRSGGAIPEERFLAPWFAAVGSRMAEWPNC